VRRGEVWKEKAGQGTIAQCQKTTWEEELRSNIRKGDEGHVMKGEGEGCCTVSVRRVTPFSFPVTKRDSHWKKGGKKRDGRSKEKRNGRHMVWRFVYLSFAGSGIGRGVEKVKL